MTNVLKKKRDYILTIESDDEIEYENDIDEKEEEEVEEGEVESTFSFDPNDTTIKERVFVDAPIEEEQDFEEELFRIPAVVEDSDEEEINEISDSDEEETKKKKKKTEDDSEEEEESEDELETEEYDKQYFAKPKKEFYSLNFVEMNLSRPLLKAINEMGYEKPTPIQSSSIKPLLNGLDMCASAQTGSGKTAAFILPILERLMFRNRKKSETRVIILLPTRELAKQCFKVTEKISKYTDITSCLIVGGIPLKNQSQALKTKPDIVIATPGRLIDHLLNTQGFGFENIEILVLDEADRLLELGFQDELEQIIEYCPKNRQTMLFSATMTDKVDKLIKLSLKNPVRIQVDNKANVSSTLSQEFIKMKDKNDSHKEALLLYLCSTTYTSETIIFCNLKTTARKLKMLFYLRGLKASELHGNLSQDMRYKALESFALHKSNFLICTDIAARGLDIKGVKTVINFDMARDLTTYIHRVGRTARIGELGISCSFVGEEDRPLLKSILKRAKKNEDIVKHRIIPIEAKLLWNKRLEKLQPKFRELQKKDEELKQLNLANMELKKVQNRIIYEKDILNRPARVWFQSEKDKKEVQNVEKEKKFRKKDRKKDEKDKKKKHVSVGKAKKERLTRATINSREINVDSLQKKSKVKSRKAQDQRKYGDEVVNSTKKRKLEKSNESKKKKLKMEE
eukprot:gene5830-9653_t